MATEPMLAAAVLAPLAAGLALLARPASAALAWLAAASALPALAAALLAPDGAAAWPTLLLGTAQRLDGPSRPLLLLVGLAWLLAGLHACAYLGPGPRRGRFLASWAVALAGNAGLVLAGDAPSFYLLFALMSFASYPLVVHDGTPSAARAGRVYLGLVVVGEVFVFAALALASHAAGTTALGALPAAVAASPDRPLILGAALVGFGVKAGLVGLHVWLPLAHPEAPTPASAVLSAAMVKAGLVGWMALLPVGGGPVLGRWLLAAGLAGAFYGVVVGLGQRNPKAVLAYSTVSQMGLVTAGAGAALAGVGGLLDAVLPLFALHHGLAKAALFLGAGAARGGGRAGRAATLLMALPALALAAAPFTSGALAKGALKALVEGSGVGGAAAPALLSASSAGTALLLVHLLRLLWRAEPDPRAHAAGPGELLPFGTLVALSAALPFAEAGADTMAATAVKAAWPVLAGLLAAAALWRFPWPAIPSGDLLSLYARAAGRAWRPVEPRPSTPLAAAGWLDALGAWAGTAEGTLRAAGGAGIALAALLAALALLAGGAP